MEAAGSAAVSADLRGQSTLLSIRVYLQDLAHLPLHLGVAGLHRASPSAALDKSMKHAMKFYNRRII